MYNCTYEHRTRADTFEIADAPSARAFPHTTLQTGLLDTRRLSDRKQRRQRVARRIGTGAFSQSGAFTSSRVSTPQRTAHPDRPPVSAALEIRLG